MTKNLCKTISLSIVICSCFTMNNSIAADLGNDEILQGIIKDIKAEKKTYTQDTLNWMAPEIVSQINPAIIKINQIVRIAEDAYHNLINPEDYNVLQSNFQYLKSLDYDTQNLGKNLFKIVLDYENDITNSIKNHIPGFYQNN